MLALWLMLLPSYYAQNHAGIIGSSLVFAHVTYPLILISTLNSSRLTMTLSGF